MRWRAFWYRLRGWKTIEELIAEKGKGGPDWRISANEIKRGRRLGIALLSTGLRFPKKGEIWEASENVKIEYMTSHHGPFTGGGTAILPGSEQIVCTSDMKPPFEGAYFRPVRYDELQEKIVPEIERVAPRYDGYYFSISTVDLNRYFRSVRST